MSSSQRWFRPFEEDLGYVSPSYHIVQDSFGYLWSATLSGLVRSDGNTYKKYFHDRADSTSLAANFSRYLHVDRNQNVWINSAGYGLSIMDREQGYFHRYPYEKYEKGLQNLAIYSMVSLNDRIYIGGSGGLEVVDVTEGNLDDLTFENLVLDERIKAAYQYPFTVWDITLQDDDVLWLSTNYGLIRYDTQTNQWAHNITDSRIPRGVGFCSYLVNEDLWIAYGGQPLIKMNIHSYEKKYYENYPLSGGEVYMEKDVYGHLWIKENGAGIGRIKLQDETIVSYPDTNNNPIGHKDRWARRMTTTHDGTLFLAGGSEVRFNHIPANHKEVNTTHREWYDVPNASSVFEDAEYVAISSTSHGVRIIDKETGDIREINTANSGSGDDLVFRVKRLRSGDFIFCGKPSAYLYNPKRRSLRELARTGLFYRNVHELDNADLWLMGESEGVTVLDQNGNRKTTPQALQVMNFRKVIEIKDGTFMALSSLAGLVHMSADGAVLRTYNPNNDSGTTLIDQSGECMIQTADGNIWVGTLGGLSVWNRQEDTWTSYDTYSGLGDSGISDLFQDGSGTVWIATAEGLYRTDADDVEIKKYALSTDFRNRGFAQRGIFSYEDRPMICGANGVDVFDPLDQANNIVPPKVQLNAVQVDEMEKVYACVECMTDIHFTPQENNIELSFAAMHYVNSQRNKVEYRVKPQDKVWRTAQEGKINLSGVDRGNVSLEVRGVNSDGVKSIPKRYNIELEKYWYQQWWGKLMLGMLLALITVLIIKVRERKLAKIQSREKAIYEELAEIELTALKAQMNPHFIFNSLNSVKTLIAERNTDDAIRYLTQYSQLVRKVLNNSNTKFIRLEDELKTCRLYLELESMRFDDGFRYEINVDDSVDVDFVEIPPMLLQPFVENAIWHGLLHKKSGEKVLTITATQKDDFVHISIMDNGIGRAAAAKINTRSRSKQKSLGTKITERRMKLMKMKYDRSTQVEFLDLHDAVGKPAGTEVKIVLEV